MPNGSVRDRIGWIIPANLSKPPEVDGTPLGGFLRPVGVTICASALIKTYSLFFKMMMAKICCFHIDLNFALNVAKNRRIDMYLHSYSEDNGGIRENLSWFECDKCGKELWEGWPRYSERVDNLDLCFDCAFIMGKIDEKYFLKVYPGPSRSIRAEVVNGNIVYYFGRKRTRAERDKRTSPEYNAWRKSVFTRDDFTCKECGKIGGKIQAHHIRSYKNNPDLRLDIENGITYCVQCHKEAHSIRRSV